MIRSVFTQAPIGAVCEMVAGGTPTSSDPSYWADSGEGIPWVSISDMSQVDVVHGTGKDVTVAGERAAGLYRGVPGTVLFAMYASVGEVAVLGTTATWNQAILGMVPRSKDRLDPRFLAWSLIALRDELPLYYRSNTQNNLNAETVARLRISFPPLETQHRIADYLDRETGQIDETITRINRVIKLMSERNRSLLRDQVLSERYPRVSLGLLTEISNGSTPSKSEPGYWSTADHSEAVPWMSSTVVNQPTASTPTAFVTPRAIKECHLPTALPGDVLVAITGQGKTRGMATILAVETTLNQHVVSVRPNKKITSGFLVTALRALYDELRRESESNGSTRAAITIEQLERFQIPLPNLDKQITITDEIASAQSNIQLMRNKASHLQSLLEERRSALITAAVTGRIEV